eukprot:gene2124-18169_t
MGSPPAARKWGAVSYPQQATDAEEENDHSRAGRYPRPAVTVDTIIVAKPTADAPAKLLLIKRKNEPFKAGILSCIYIVTALLSEILTNNAAAALMFPIATIAGDALGASASFISPFGYQCNLMVFNAGAMKFKDLASLGVPIQLWMWIGATLIMGLDSVYIMLGISLGLAITVSIGAVFQDHIRARIHYLKVPSAFIIPRRTSTEQRSHL